MLRDRIKTALAALEPLGITEADHAKKGYDLDVQVAADQLPAVAEVVRTEGFFIEAVTGVDWFGEQAAIAAAAAKAKAAAAKRLPRRLQRQRPKPGRKRLRQRRKRRLPKKRLKCRPMSSKLSTISFITRRIAGWYSAPGSLVIIPKCPPYRLSIKGRTGMNVKPMISLGYVFWATLI